MSAAIYLRSSKDRSDLSIDAQRRALHDYAAGQGLALVAEFSDAVESGMDDDRPGFQQLLAALQDPGRGWDTILALDTARIARRRHLAVIFEHQAEKAGVRILYRTVPDTDPITGMLLRSILQAMDEWHSLTSKAKGLAGMAEAVRQGYRAGGRAPRGYRLEQIATGTIREGQPVMRSRLQLADDAEAVAMYLRARAAGKPRGLASELSGITGSLNDMEWRALVYAGHTVWGQSNEQGPDGYKGGSKYRPRSDWHITRHTHPALISDDEAEAILSQLAAGQGRRSRAGDRVYLLSGLLVAPDGTALSGEFGAGSQYYRHGKGRKVAAKALERAVLDQVFADLAAPEVAARIAADMRAQAAPRGKPRDLAALRSRLATLDRQIERLVLLIVDDEGNADAYRRSLTGKEREREAVRAELEQAAQERETARMIELWTPTDVQRLLAGLRQDLETGMEDGDVAGVRRALAEILDRIIYDPETRQAIIHYRLAAPDTRVNMASPGRSTIAPVEWASSFCVAGRVRALKRRP